MKQLILLFNFLALTFFTQAQEKVFYKINNKNIEFNISQKEMYVEFAENQKSAVQRISAIVMEELSTNSAILKMPDLQGTYQNRKEGLQDRVSTKFQRIEPVLIYKDGTKQIAKGELNIKLKTNTSIEDLLKNRSFTIQSNEFDKDLYLVKLNLETSELFELVNQLTEDSRVVYAEPNFIRMIKPHTDDPFFSSQWSINNQGYLGGTVDADMDVDDAWNHTTGTGIKVAVIDDGVDLSHTDLTANLLTGYDATDGSSNGAPNESRNDAHGTACAGIIAAVANNTNGTAGVAYSAKIIPVRIAYSVSSISTVWITSDNWIANGINWAWQNGADVLSNSYGGGSYSSVIENAINNAVNNGRSGKGSVVLFSSGNDPGGDGDPVSFPATVESVISVGASSMCDTRKNLSSCDGENWGSNYGAGLDLVAPGVKIYTTDISGSNGYGSGDYISNFNGTSSACPNAAGVVALILSANQNLTQHEAREILERNVDKVSGYSYITKSGQPNGTWNSQVGYGRINAKKAVEEALLSNISITGSEIVCSSNTTFNLQGGNNPTWSKSYNLSLVSSNNNSITVKASSSTVGGQGYVRATFANGIFIQKDFWVGVPVLGYDINEDFTMCRDINSTSNNFFPVSIESMDASTTWQVQRITNNHTISTQGNEVVVSLQYAPPYNYIAFKVRASNSCGFSDWLEYYIEVIDNCSSENYNGYMVYPNPSSESVTIQKKNNDIKTQNSSDVQYEIFDFNSNSIYKNYISNDKAVINVSKLKKGRYILKIYGMKEEETHHLIVQ
ncbi:S8 family serine peptidase [Leeuwenhoekiella marinoflava]|uniref:S8 family serine peptidase n=1 Tax=Leeuwenhoekiella marinoflava TaxID=988 RepID=UPI003002253E